MTSFSVHFSSVEQIAQKSVRKSMAGITQSLTRLSTGKRINSAKDDPAAFIAAELTKSENAETRANLKTTKALGLKLGAMDSYLASIGNLLNDIKGSIVEGANTGALSEDEQNALQLQIDYALDAVERITNTASFKGEKLFEGLFGVLGSSENPATAESKPNTDASTQCAPCASGSDRLLQTDSLTNWVNLFAAGNESGGLFSNISSFLGKLSKTLDGSTIDIPEAETVEAETSEENVDEEESVEEAETELAEELVTKELAAEDVAEETVAGEVLVEGALVDGAIAEEVEEPDPFEEFFEMERNRDEIDEAEESSEATETETVEEDTVAVEESIKKTTQEKEPENSEAGLLYESPNGYEFRMLRQFDFLDEVEEEAEDFRVRYEVDFSLDATQADVSGSLLAHAVLAAPTLRQVDLNESSGQTLDLLKDDKEEDDSEEETTVWGGLSDLRTGGSASLKNDPGKADVIIGRAISSLSLMRAKIGAEQKYTIDVDISMLQDKLVQNETFLSELSDTDYALEMTNLAKNQLLLQTSMKALQFSQNLTGMLLNLLDAGYNAGMSATTGRSS